MPNQTAPDSTASQSNVGKAFEIIRAVTESPKHSATVAEVAEALSLPRPTANRIISNLIKLGLLKRDGGGIRIIEGDLLVELASTVLQSASMRGPRHEVLKQLVIDTRETANVGTLVGGEVLYLDRVEAAWPLAFRLDPGSRVPIYCSAIGKLLLSQMPPDQREKYLDAMTLTRRTPTTICDPKMLRQEIERIAEQGVAIDDEECFNGVLGIAVPIVSTVSTPPMALALAAPSGRQTPDLLRGFLPAMRSAAERLGRCYEP